MRTGQPQGAVLFEGDIAFVGRSNKPDAAGPGCKILLHEVSPILGKSSGMILKSMQAPRERKKWPVEFVTYVICLVEYIFPRGSVPDSSRKTAPIISMYSSLAVRIFVVTGIRSEGERFNFGSMFEPVRQLWHPVSAST